MKRRALPWLGLGLALLAIAGAAWLLMLPPAPASAAPAPIAAAETKATLESLKPRKRARPLIAVIGINDATETTDYLLPYGVLKRAGVADVLALSTRPGPMTLYPALKVEPEATIAQFDARYPDGADYVIVPAMSPADDPQALRWIREQSAKGAVVIGVCVGATVVANAGLLDGRRATTHWYVREGMLKRHPGIRYAPDRRFVVDRGVATTTGITASIPMTLTLIEAIAGRDKAQSVAAGLGLADWDARHDSGAFRFNRPFALAAMRNKLAFWNRERYGIALVPGLDEVSLALVADAWSRTYRSQALTYSPSAEAQPTHSGLRIVPDRVAADWPVQERLKFGGGMPAKIFDSTLQVMAARYDPQTAYLVAMQLEYPGPPPAQP